MAKIKLKRKKARVTYSGSLIQQNFGETLDRHGFLAWDLDTMTYEEIDIQNDYGYYTMDIDNGKVPVVNDMPKHPRLRVRLSNTDTADTKKVIAEIKMKYGVEDFTIIRTDSLSKKKTGDRGNKLDFENIADINYQNSLINEYVERMMPFVDKKDLAQLERINRDVNSRIVHEDTLRNIQWKPVRFEFSNMFSYGEDNKIDFTKLNGLMGLFAPNAQGKSSIFDAISFCLYDKSSRAFKAANILNNRKTDFRCYLHFQVNGVDYHIERTAKTINKGKNVKVDVNFWYIDLDNQKVSLNGTERRDTNTVIEQYVGKYEDFVLTALSLQGNNSIFIDKSQSERKDLLAQFMGLNVFDKLYETGLEDIKEVSVLIKNFKKTDFTTELADKVNELKDKKGELKDLETELNQLNANKGGLDSAILELSRNLTPIGVTLNIDDLNDRKEKLEGDIIANKDIMQNKTRNITTITEKMVELAESINEKKQLGEVEIEEAKRVYDRAINEKKNTGHFIALMELSIESNRQKIAHLDNHQYDPNCKFCCDNVFVKDAMKAKEELVVQGDQIETLNIAYDALLNQITLFGDIETQWNEYNGLKNELEKAKAAHKNYYLEFSGLITKEELYKTQLESVEDDIKKYNDNQETIESNKELEKGIKDLEVEKKSLELEIKNITKQIATTNGSISSLQTYIDSIKQKMNEVKDLEEKNRLYTYYLDAVKRDGIPYELISKALPVIENEVNNILAQVVDFGVTMEMDGKSINAKIVYEDQEWPLEMCSGMEKFVSGLAIRVALINVCNLPRPNFLVVDEGFGTLDADNLSSLFMMMQYLKTQFDFIWVISHLEQMRDIVDGLIEIKKVNGFSKIDF
jgi:DNA repair exonuclease SbcCD ATPase subunit